MSVMQLIVIVAVVVHLSAFAIFLANGDFNTAAWVVIATIYGAQSWMRSWE